MDDQKKSNAQLLEELDVLRHRVQELEQSEIELRECCEVYRTIFEMAPHLTSITRVNDGLYLQVNEAFCRLTGYSVEEAVGRTPFDLHLYPDPADRQRLLEAMRQDGRVEGMEIKFKRKNGAIIYDLVSARPYRFKGEDCLLLMATEITPLKEIEESLRVSEEKYRIIIENMEEGYFEVDLAGNYTFVNEAVCRYHGRTHEELMGMNNREYMSPETAKEVFTIFNEKYRLGTSAKRFDFGYEIIRKDGTARRMQMSASLKRDAAGHIIGFRGITWDVTEQRKIEAEREKYRDFVENAEDGCFEVDPAGNMTFLNDAACRIFGYPREELMGLNNRRYTTPETAKKIFKTFNEIYRTGIPAKVFDYEIIHKDGQTRYLNMSVSLIRESKGNPVGFRGINQDVTKRKNMDAEKERLTQQLNQAGKMEAIGTLAGGIAHDFNNLLMGIQGCISLILLDLDPRHPHYEKLKAVEAQVKTGAELTRQLLGYARGGRYEILPTNMNELLSKTSAMLGRMKKDIRIHHQFAQKPWLVEADRDQIEQVLMSLFMNASEAMPGGGTLYLETENVLLDESFVRPYEIKLGPYVKVSVTDTGVGMDEKTKERIFEPFFTTKEMGRGVGLGLAPVYGIIKGHGGLIEVFSEKGQGTAFIIYLPAFQKERIKQEQPVKETTAGRETILLVDDEKFIIDVVGSMISGLGYQLIIARSGEEAVELFR
ncbi:MAG: PAS domain S-box protein, partial [Deltaproteobacteria bacterium]|nr:PAS domain S-box protein [Deltaproteobacteria bacterium]